MENLNDVNASQEPVVGATNTDVSPEIVEGAKASEVTEPTKPQQTVEENQAFKQMRLKQEELEAKLKKAEEVAKLYGYKDADGNASVDDLFETIRTNYERQQIDSLVSDGIPEEVAKELAELRKVKEESEAIKAARQREERIKADNLEFMAMFRELNGRDFTKDDTVPQEVLDKAADGLPLKYAYLEYTAREKAKAEKAASVNTANAETSAPSMASTTVDKTFYSQNDVANMSREEVKKNWKVIAESMKKPSWKK